MSERLHLQTTQTLLTKLYNNSNKKIIGEVDRKLMAVAFTRTVVVFLLSSPSRHPVELGCWRGFSIEQALYG